MSREAFCSHRLQGRNSSLFQRFYRGAPLASILGVLVCAQVSCLIPQTVDPIVAAPHPAPYFVVEQIPGYLSPPQLTLIRQGASDASSDPEASASLKMPVQSDVRGNAL